MTRPPWRNPDALTLPALLRDAALARPRKIFIDLEGEAYSFADIERQSNRLARGLAGLGVARGDVVATFLDTSIDAVLVWFAVTKLGAVVSPINISFRGEYLRHQIADCRCAHIIIEAGYVDRLAAVADELPALNILVRGARSHGDPGHCRGHALDRLFAGDDAPIETPVGPGDLAALIYTSGTTGRAKGCMVGHNALCSQGYDSKVRLGITEADIVWMAAPLFHASGVSMIIACLRLGATLALSARFSVSGFWAEIERSKATVIFAFSTMFPLLADAPATPEERRCFGQVNTVFGVPFLGPMQQRWKERFGVRLTASAGYGMTEVTVAGYPGHAVPPESAGQVSDHLDVRIVDDDGMEVVPGEAGEIVVRPLIPYAMFDGYWHRPDATAEAFRDLWFHCGDIGRIDRDGNLFFVDRKKDYLRSRGENVSSHELETILRGHPDIEEVAVHAVPSRLSEDDIKATLIRRTGATIDEAALCRWMIERLPYFAVPRYIEFRTDLPRNAIGRILKYELRAEGVTDQTWDREAVGLQVRR